MTIQNEGIGYKDLDELFNNPTDLQFIIELLSVESSDDYEKDSWQLDDDEKVTTIEKLKGRGNEFFKLKNMPEAEKSYGQALGMVEQLMLKEKPNDDEWNDLSKMKIPLLLNFSQCRLIDKDYYQVIEYCTEVIGYDPGIYFIFILYKRSCVNRVKNCFSSKC